jgi:hypothetical protein
MNRSFFGPIARRPRRRSLEMEPLESRAMLSGTWTPLTHPAPSNISTMMLLSDGTVMAQAGGTLPVPPLVASGGTTSDWYRLAPDSSGSYVNGTWSRLASMRLPRLYYASNMLPDGRVFVMGGEYSGTAGDLDFTNTGEIYNPVTDTWSDVANFPQSYFGDDPSEVLPDGRVLAGFIHGRETYIYDPASDRWSSAADKLRDDPNDEETWIKLPDDSILSYDVFVGGPPYHAQRYVPSTNRWVDAGTVPVSLSGADVGYEIGPAFLLPDGRAWFTGATGETAYYTPPTNTWAAGPRIPDGLAAQDNPGAMMPDGHVLIAVGPRTPLFHGPTTLFDFDPTTNAYANASPAGNLMDLGSPTVVFRMLVLPSGQVLMTNGTGGLVAYTPGGSPVPFGRPTISAVAKNADNPYRLTGTQLNGISEGASYGDDAEMSSNYPIVRLTDLNGHVYYARTYGWSSTGVATGSTPESTNFTLPPGLPAGTYSLVVVANGIASQPASFTTTVTQAAPTLTATPVSPVAINLSWTAVAGATSYELQGRWAGTTGWYPNNGTSGQVTTGGLTSLNTGLSAGATYEYRVRALTSGGYTEYSPVVAATTVMRSAPTLTAQAASPVAINLSWTAVAEVAGYELQGRLAGTTDWYPNNPTGGHITTGGLTYQNTGLAVGTKYEYRVRALDDAGNPLTDWSMLADATTDVNSQRA